jgi:plastocyanin
MRQRVWFYDKVILGTGLGALLLAAVFAVYTMANASQPARAAGAGPQPAAAGPATTYTPQTRDLVVTAVPLLVHEQAGFFDYLNHDFGTGGMLKGKEVWAFSPNSLTVYQGDTVHVTVVNPGDDPHTFTISEMNFSMKVRGQSQREGSFVVPSAGLYKFFCSIPEHMPYMWGSLVVLPDSAAPQS